MVKKKKKRQKKRKNRSSLRVPPPIPVHASKGSDSICLLHSPPGKLHMESHTGPKYKLPRLTKAWVSFPYWWTDSSLSPHCRRQHPPLWHLSPGCALPWPLCQVQPLAPPTPCCRAAAPGERPASFRSDGEAAVGPQTFTLSPASLEELLELTANCIKYEGEGKGGGTAG